MTVDLDTRDAVALPTPIGRLHHHDDRRSRRLRSTLARLDAATYLSVWLVVAVGATPDRSGLPAAAIDLGVASIATLVAVLTAAVLRLYRARVCVVRTAEAGRVARTAVVSGLAAAAASNLSDAGLGARSVVAGVVVAAVLHIVVRGAFRAWLRAERFQGRHTRPVLLVGANDEAFELWHLLHTQRELGFEVLGAVGPRAQAAGQPWELDWLGEVDGTLAAIRRTGATGVIMAISAFTLDERTRLVRSLLGAGVHVQLSSGLSRIDPRRLRAQPLARESLYYLEPRTPTTWNRAVKRAVDLVIGTTVLVLTLPVVGIAALAIRIESRGPVFYRQQRVGRNGELFTIWKLRTMVVDAEARLAELRARNEMVDGPLFKLDDDPRITRVGRILRATSIDELPQLFSVLRGTMSLVGPRPALPDEVEQFDDELLQRQTLRPGISGLWQIEARDNTCFAAYRRLDLFYLDNWSVGLDLAIIGATIEEVIARALVLLRRKPAAVPVAAEATAA